MRAGKPSRTAQQNALFRALEARRSPARRIADDRLAARFLPPEFRILAELARIPPIRRVIEEVIDRRWPGPRMGMVVRTRLIDDVVSSAIADVDQVLILGAGFDTRPYRLDGMDAIPVFEVDHPATQTTKNRIVRRAIGRASHNVTFVPVDFGRDDIDHALRTAGFASGIRTLVLWEGVTNYLTAEAVDSTFRFVVMSVGSGSRMLFTYVDRGVIDGSKAFEGAAESSRAVRRVGEPYTFGFEPAELRAYLCERGLELTSDVTVAEAAERYLSEHDRLKVYEYYHVTDALTV